MIDFLVTRLPSDPGPVGSSPDEEEAPEAERTVIKTLERYVDATTGTPAASALAEALVYENNVTKALMANSWGSANLRVFRGPHDTGADAILRVEGRRVLVLIKWGRDPVQVRSMVLQGLRHIGSAEGTLPTLVITPVPILLRAEQSARFRAVVAQWNSPRDGDELAAAARRASLL